MKKKIFKGLAGALLPVACIISLQAQPAESDPKATLVINTDLGTEVISRHIYGHFSEHLGRCIYGGYWVGEDSDIANTRGIRNDVV